MASYTFNGTDGQWDVIRLDDNYPDDGSAAGICSRLDNGQIHTDIAAIKDWGNEFQEEMEANASLMALAPKILQVLMRIKAHTATTDVPIGTDLVTELQLIENELLLSNAITLTPESNG